MTQLQITVVSIGALILLLFVLIIYKAKLIHRATVTTKPKEPSKTIEKTTIASVIMEDISEEQADKESFKAYDNNNEEDNDTEQTAKKETLKRDTYHISQNKNDESDHAKEWRIRKQGSDKTIKFFSTQKEAIGFAKNLASKNNGKVVIHKLSGAIRKKKYN